MNNYIDLSGQKISKLTVIKLSNDKKDSNGTTKLWECHCDCGNIVYKSARVLNEYKKLHKNASCGCAIKKDLTGKRIGDLSVKKYLYSKNKNRYWYCECVCGDNFVKSSSYLLKSKCLCSRKQQKQKQYIARIRKIFYKMKSRCYKENDTSYYDYGGRGIKICKQWLNDINKFICWSLTHGYSPMLEIDRINNNGNYEPKNCRWVDKYTQANNKRNNLNINYNGKTQCLRKWCRELNLPYRKTHKRIVLYKWNIEKCFAEKERVGF